MVPAYNAADFIEQTLASACAQLPADELELIVVDDGSTDATADLVRGLHPGATLVRTENAGVSAARTTGFARARGAYVKFLDADDLLPPGRIAAQLSLATQTEADVVYGDWQRLVWAAGGWRTAERVARRWEDIAPTAAVAFFAGMWCPTGAYLWRTAFLRTRHPGCHRALPVIQDARFALDAARAGARFVYSGEVEALYRVHRSASVSTRSTRAFWLDCERNAREIAASFSDVPEGAWRHAMLTTWAQIARASHDVDRALSLRAWAALEALDPTYVPSHHPLYRLLARILPPRHIEQLLGLTRALRRRGAWAQPREGCLSR